MFLQSLKRFAFDKGKAIAKAEETVVGPAKS
jgi:hypothetical protein